MKAKVYSHSGEVTGEVELPGDVFGADVNEHLMHLVIQGYLANRRQGTAKAKRRSEVSGGGTKPWRQKGTGHARAGSNTSPLWRRGGAIFGPVPKDHSTTVPAKMRRRALRSALSCRARDEKIMVVEPLAIEQPKTKTMASILKALDVGGAKTLLVVPAADRTVWLSGRNIKNLLVRPLNELNTYDVLNSDTVIFAGAELIEKSREVVSL
jgi:large subunit ribosomal protein L4